MNAGWDSRALDAMSEVEFMAVLGSQLELDEARAAAQAKAMEE